MCGAHLGGEQYKQGGVYATPKYIPVSSPEETMRQFKTGATRNIDASKYDYEGFLSPLVLTRFAEYMHKNRVQADGKVRDSDNWQKGMPLDAYIKSGWRHFMEWWSLHRSKEKAAFVLEEALCALLFNVQGYLHEHLKAKESK